MIDLNRLQDMVVNGHIETVIIAAADMQGKLFGKRVTADYFLESAQKGIHACAVNLVWDVSLDFQDNYEFCSLDNGLHDMVIKPDMSTLRLYPWCEKTVLVLGDLQNKDQTEISVAPRTILKRQIQRAKDFGYKVNAASELEFYLFKETEDTLREKNYHQLSPLFPYPVDYSINRLTRDDRFLSKITRHLTMAGIPVESIKGEWGKGQYEINLKYSDALRMADHTAVYKNAVKELAAMDGLTATFMAKPVTDDSGSSGHTHISLWDLQSGKNLFYDPLQEHGISNTGRYFLGGVMELASEFMLFYAPYINSYKRLIAGMGAPNTLTWGVDNRTTSFRSDGKEKSMRLENRVPGADANFYLVIAACIASGLYGIENKIEPPACTTTNAYNLSNIGSLPLNLMEAVERLDHSERVRALLGNDVVDHYLTAAKMEIQGYLSEVTDWERRKYFEFI
ncbi:glutamine synthetase [Peribacillus sp. TH16]|uniref:glutamine synthetase family protein n=1 Tax=unclassified Peribacillus TaxID=2675266 RepID=UPI001913A66E|nr:MULTISPECIES: glutamine synthetase family protein [unclassified Peribacillus]MBK5458351.1 glutamine synthetase [Peribacillus sp. TH27]MBK5483133.1 glutamine synthetase [Peribacillus sp. TH16]WMX53323.1 glutamine synthetase family protein [Peribacillus sp. R9-11]